MSLARGESRLRDAVRKYGARRVLGNMKALLDYSERIMRARIRSLPDGRYRFEDYLDGDGMGSGPLPIRVKISIHGSEASVDFTGTARQAAGPVNANLAVTLSAVSYVFRCLLGEEAPFTAGLMRPIQVEAPEGSLVHARPPAAMAAGNVETSQRITDVLLGALSKAAPDLIPAASSGTMNNVSLGGWDPFRRRPFAYYETIAGGMGAHCRGPGQDAVHTHMTNSWNTPIEALEHEYPLTVRAYRIRRGSGGEGRHRGGDGIIRAIEFLTGAEVTLLSERRETRPYGLQGGGAGQAGVNRLRRGGKAILLPAKVRTTVLAGDRLEVETPGGGGFGKPARET
jgi:N-methylhydantoinase B